MLPFQFLSSAPRPKDSQTPSLWIAAAIPLSLLVSAPSALANGVAGIDWHAHDSAAQTVPGEDNADGKTVSVVYKVDADGAVDTDNDGVSDDDEIILGTDPNEADFDNDGINDFEDADDDNDGIPDVIECNAGSLALINGSFEQPVIVDGDLELILDDAVPGWSTSASDELIEVWRDGFLGIPSQLGQQFVELSANEVSILSQEIQTTPGQPYLYRFYHRGRDGVDTLAFNVGDADDMETLRTISTGNGDWQTVLGVYTIPESQGLTTFAFEAISNSIGSGASGNLLDGVSFEPGCTLDTDEDGLVNSLDLDSDGDGLYDAEEAGHALDHTDGVVLAEVGSNGLADAVEASVDSGVLVYIPTQSDDDGIADFLDVDSDDDGIEDDVDNCLTVANGAQVDSNDNGIGDACEEGLETPTPGEETPTATLETPTEVLVIPTATLETPTEVLVTPTATLETPTEVLPTPTEVLTTPTEMPATPTEVLATPTAEPTASASNSPSMSPDEWEVEGGGCECNQSSDNRRSASLAFAMAGLLVFAGRRRPSKALLAALVAIVTASMVSPALAQDDTLSIQRFDPAPGGSLNYNQVEGAQIMGHLKPTFGLWVNDGFSPLVVSNSTDSFTVVSQDLAIDVMAGIGLGKRLQLGVAFPVTVALIAGDDEGGPDVELNSQAVGDLRIVPKFKLLDGESLALALSVPISIPTGSPDDLHGEAGVTFQPRLIAELTPSERLKIAANVGYLARTETQTFLGMTSANEVRYGLGVAYALSPEKVTLIAEGFGGAVLPEDGFSGLSDLPVEANLAARFHLGETGAHSLTIGGGPGLTVAYGTPTARAFLGWAYTPLGSASRDKDGDGLNNDEDECPAEAEDFDGFQDEDGCPDRDNDGDGISDSSDKCPDDPEDMDDVMDQDGCPETDADNDGILDEFDRCPTEPETMNGIEDEDGCPEGSDEDASTISQVIYFDLDSSLIRQDQQEALEEVVGRVMGDSSLTLISVEGHADDRGTTDYNIQLGRARAETIRRYLINSGVDKARLRTVSYGEEKPASNNYNEEGRQLNRRVELMVLEVDGISVSD